MKMMQVLDVTFSIYTCITINIDALLIFQFSLR